MSKKGTWEVKKGKGERYYINCLKDKGIGHSDVLDPNGLLLYELDHLKDLAICIFEFLKEKEITGQLINNIPDQ